MDFKEWYHTVLSYKDTDTYLDLQGLYMFGVLNLNQTTSCSFNNLKI